jgi:aminopeptidase N
MRRSLLAILIVLAVAAIVASIYILRMPRTPDEYLRRALALEKKLKAQITRLKSKDLEKNRPQIARLESKITQQYERLTSRFPASPEAVEAEYRLVLFADAKGENFAEVARRYESFLKSHPDSRRKRDILLRLAEINLREVKSPLAAIKWYEEFVKEFPQDDYADDALFEIAKVYEDIREYQSAVSTLKRLLAQYAQSPLADEAQYRIANLLAERLKKYRAAIESFNNLEKRAGDSKYILLARSQRQSLEQRLVDEESEQYFTKYYGGVGETSAIEQPLDEWNHPVIKQIREQGLDVQHYDIQVALSPRDRATSAIVHMQIGATKDLSDREIIFQLNPDLQITSLSSADEHLPFERKEQFIYVTLNRPLKAQDSLALEIHYAGTCSNSWKGDVITSRGVHLRPESKWYPMTWWADAASCDVNVIVPAAFRAVSVGTLVATQPQGDMTEYRWREESQIAGITLVAGELEQYSERLDGGIEVMCFAAPKNLSVATAQVRHAKDIISFYSARFGAYPFKKLALAEAPLFPGGYGASSLVLLGKGAFSLDSRQSSLLAHELAHQWWGSKVLVALTEDSIPWLSEGFATYSDALYIEFHQGVEPFRRHLRQLARQFSKQSIFSPTQSIRGTWWSSPMYHALTYEKGALVLHALRFVMGDEKFFAALRTYADAFAFRAATVSDFQRVCEGVYGESLEWFFKEWLDGTSLPHFKITEAIATAGTAADGKQEYRTRIVVGQMGDPVKMPLEVTLHCAGDVSSRKRIWVEREEQSIEFSSPSLPERAVLDEDSWILSLSSPDELERKVELLEAR